MKDKTKTGWGGPRPNSGRKALSAEERRDKKVMITMTQSEHREALDAAGEKPLGTYIREVFLRHLARRKK